MGTLKISLLISMGLYFLLMVFTSIMSREKNKPKEFTIANRDLGYLPVISSLAASFRDGSGIIAWVGFGFAIGYGGLWLMLGVLLGLSVYSWFGPKMRQTSIQYDAITVGELLRTALGPITEKLSASLVLIFSLVIISVQMYVAGNLFAEIIGLEPWLGMCIVAIIVGSYLLLGGYNAVVKTDVIQFILILSIILIPMFVMTDSKKILDLSSLFTFPHIDRVAFFLVGFFFVLSSADIWQKVFAARNASVISRGFPVSGVILIIMTLSLIWLGMTAQGLLVGKVETGQVLFELFNQSVLPTWMLVLLAIVALAITMSTLDTHCYLFSSSLSKNFLAKNKTADQKQYVLINRVTMLVILIISVALALLIKDIIQTIFNAGSLLFILAPVYVALGFGWLKKSQLIDRLVSISILISMIVYLILFIRGDLENMIMLVIPVMTNIILLVFVLLFSRKQA